MVADRPKIPAGIKRDVRKRCGYGCVICGSPVYHYDHMIEYSVTEKHESDNITLLCPGHHHEKTVNRLPLKKVQAANSSPYNRDRSTTTGHVLGAFTGTEYAFRLGTNLFRDSLAEGGSKGIAINVDGGDVLSARVVDGELLIRAYLRDKCNRPLLRIHDNELVHSTVGWDIVFEANRLTMWDDSRRVGLEIHFDEDGISIVRGEFWANGFEFAVTAEGDLVGPRGTTFGHCEVHAGGFYAGDPLYRPWQTALDFGDPPRYEC